MSNKEDKYVCITKIEEGIGNRLKTLFSYITYYNFPRDIDLIWPNKGWVNKCFFDLFKFDIGINIKEYSHELKYSNKNIKKFFSWRFYVKNNGTRAYQIDNDDPFDVETFRIDFLYNKTPKEFIDLYGSFFANLLPSEKVEKIIQTTDVTSDMVAVQIRDNDDWTKWGRSEYLNEFIKEMKKFPQSTKFFISVMNKQISDKIKKLFPNQIIEVKNKNYNSMYYAVADLFLLSIPNKALCSCGSTFYEVAWWINGCHAQVKIIGNYSNWAENKNNIKSLYKIFKRKCCSFIRNMQYQYCSKKGN